MADFKITIKDPFFKKEFTGVFIADTQDAAEMDALNFYAQELDTDINELIVTNTERI